MDNLIRVRIRKSADEIGDGESLETVDLLTTLGISKK